MLDAPGKRLRFKPFAKEPKIKSKEKWREPTLRAILNT